MPAGTSWARRSSCSRVAPWQLRAVRQLGLVSDEAFQNAVSRPGGIAGIVSLFRGKDAKPAAPPRTLESREAEAVDECHGRIARSRPWVTRNSPA